MKKLGEQAKEKLGRILKLVADVVGIALIVVLLPLMGANLTLIIKSYVHPAQVPTVFGVAPLVVLSGSMEPTILLDDLIFSKTVDTKTIKDGDIITFYPEGEGTVVTHRVVASYEEEGVRYFSTKGDANNGADTDPVSEFQVLGLYFKRIGGLGKAAMFLQQPVGMVVFVAIPLALFLLYDLLLRVLHNRKRKAAKAAEQEEREKERLRNRELEEEVERLRALAAGLVPAPAWTEDQAMEDEMGD